ncbi:lamina-associated polypeptide 2-like [Bufo gargarizans]|uniref:lamina-associated polypeptide 2-like n=1 Tax=Bufo gargarizans TaxID=30331 RepID=UPI001CF51F44|nr:lamina-associated polypeptide 2-like [Bufo gargarizans]
MIQEEIRSSLAHLSTNPPDLPQPKKKRARSPSPSDIEVVAEESAHSVKSWEEGERVSDSDDDGRRYYFSTEEMSDLLKAVRSTMGVEEVQRTHSVQEEMFGGLRVKKTRVFPINESIRDMILDEWTDPEKRLGVPATFKNRLLFDPEESKIFNEIPKIDVQVAKVNKKTSLPFEDASQLKDSMDRKADSLLRKSWEASMFNVKTNIAATSVARSMFLWLGELETHIKDRASREQILESLPLLKSATAFLADASAESVRFSARDAALSNAARRALWMKCWSGDKTSKLKLCSIPFSGEYVFGPVLDKILEKAADKKKGFPEDRPSKRRYPFRPPSGQEKSYRGKGKSGRWSYPKGGRGRGQSFSQQKPSDKQ